MKTPPLSIVGEALKALSAYTTKPDPASVKLDANESPWALPISIQNALAEEIATLALHRYPDIRAQALRAALAEKLGGDIDELILGVGSDEVIGILMAALDRPRAGVERPVVLFPTPTFVMYPITAKVQGFDPVAVPLRDDFGLDLPAMLQAIEMYRPNLIFLATPNNPTGNAFEVEAMKAIVEAAPDSLVVIDEAYGPFASERFGGWVEEYANVGVLGTLSKVGLAGIRLGWIRMNRALAAQVEKARPPYNINAPAQLIATQLLTRHWSVVEAQVAQIVAERSRLVAALQDMDGLRVLPSEANFLLLEFADAASSVHQQLLAQDVQVRFFKNNERLHRHLRVTVGTPEENDALVAALKTVLAG